MVNLGQSNSLDEHRSRQATASLRPPDASRIANPGSVSNTEVGRSSWVCHGLTQLRLLFWLLTTLRTPPSGHPATSNCHKRDTTKLMLFPFSCGRCYPCSTQVPSERGPLPALCVPQLLHDLGVFFGYWNCFTWMCPRPGRVWSSSWQVALGCRRVESSCPASR